MDVLDLNCLTLEQAPTESVPVPAAIARELAEHPEIVGLELGASKRRALGELVLLGYRTAYFQQREREREDFYRRLAEDPESRSVAAASFAASREDGLF